MNLRSLFSKLSCIWMDTDGIHLDTHNKELWTDSRCRCEDFWIYRFQQKNRPRHNICTYVMIQWTNFDRRLLTYKKIFLKKYLKKVVLSKFVFQIFTLLLAPFASKLVNYSQHIESLNHGGEQRLPCLFWFTMEGSSVINLQNRTL